MSDTSHQPETEIRIPGGSGLLKAITVKMTVVRGFKWRFQARAYFTGHSAPIDVVDRTSASLAEAAAFIVDAAAAARRIEAEIEAEQDAMARP